MKNLLSTIKGAVGRFSETGGGGAKNPGSSEVLAFYKQYNQKCQLTLH